MAQLRPSTTVTAGSTADTNLNNINLLQPTGFKLVVDRKRFTNLEFFCQSINLPSLDANPVEMPFRRITTVPFAADKLTYGALSANILLDENMNSYVELYNWMHRIVENEEYRPSERANDNIPTYADISVMILSSHNNQTRIIRFLDCIPTSLGDVALEANSGDVQGIIVPATFRFAKYTIQ